MKVQTYKEARHRYQIDLQLWSADMKNMGNEKENVNDDKEYKNRELWKLRESLALKI